MRVLHVRAQIFVGASRLHHHSLLSQEALEVGSFVGLRRWACRPCIVAIPHDQYPLARPRSLLPVCVAVDSTRTSGWQRPQAPFGQDIQHEQHWAVFVHWQPEELGVGQ